MKAIIINSNTEYLNEFKKSNTFILLFKKVKM